MIETVIWKYELKIVDEQIVEMPFNANILSIGVQKDNLVLWAQVIPDKTRDLAKRKIYINGTGHIIKHKGKFIQTIITHYGALVWHIFDGGEV